MKKSILVGVAVILIVLLGSYLYFKGTPQYSLYQFRKAVENGDGDAALKYFDVDSIVDNMMKETVLEETESLPKNQWETAGRNFGKAMVMMMLPAMKEQIKSTIKTAITSSERSNLDGLKKNRIWDLDIESEGRIAFVTPKNDASIRFKMAKTSGGYWKIVEFINEAEKKKKVARKDIDLIREAVSRFALDNDNPPEELSDLVSNRKNSSSWKGPYLKEVKSDPWGRPYHYRRIGVSGYGIVSFGKDGTTGGDREDEDLKFYYPFNLE